MERNGGSVERLNLYLHTNGPSSDLLNQGKKRSYNPNREDEQLQNDDDEIELSLGLSLNGRFGVDPAQKKLKRSSSISNLVFAVGGGGNGTRNPARGVDFEAYAPPVRTRSLPTETEEEWRRRKEMQYLRRMEARKKRMEKLKNVRVGAPIVGRVVKDKERYFEDVVVNWNGSGEDVSSGIVNGNNVMLSSQGSIEFEPLGSSSSGNSDLMCRQIEGAKQNTDSPSPSTVLQHSQDEREQEPIPRASANGDVKRDSKASLKNAMQMPYVTTKGLGPNDRKVEGFLYGYKKGEEVRIVCVCHGLFLTPAEFVKHGGGGGDDDMEHPLKHIVVNPFPLL